MARSSYKFSFVIPVYNAEKYLAETIESLLAQELDFAQNCEIILVNDDSPDDSEAICRKYQAKFPDNIIYLKQKHGGTSVAKNRGIKKARGKYTMFLDSDDKLSADTTARVFDFFERHYDEIDYVAIKFELFGSNTSDHFLNYKFTRSRVINIEQEFDCIQLAGGAVFFKTEVFSKGYCYDPAMRRGEDTKLLLEIVLDKMTYGVVKEPTYYYRQTDSGTSITASQQSQKEWYLHMMPSIYEYMFDYSTKKLGYIPKYIQYAAAYAIGWRLYQKEQTILTAKELRTYKALLWSLIKCIDDDVIMRQKNITLEYKIFLLNKKHGISVIKIAERHGNKYYFAGQLVFDPNWRKPQITVGQLSVEGSKIILGGTYNSMLFTAMKVVIRFGSGTYDAVPVEKPERNLMFLDELVSPEYSFEVQLPLRYKTTAEAYVVMGDDKIPLAIKADEVGWRGARSRPYKVVNGVVFSLKDGKLTMLKDAPQRRLVKRISGRNYKTIAKRLLSNKNKI